MHPQNLLFVAACFMYFVAVFTFIYFVLRWWSCFPWTVFHIDLNERTKEVKPDLADYMQLGCMPRISIMLLYVSLHYR